MMPFAHFFLYSSFISVSWNGDITAGATAAIMDHKGAWDGKMHDRETKPNLRGSLRIYKQNSHLHCLPSDFFWREINSHLV